MDELQSLRFQGEREAALALCRANSGLKALLVAARIEMEAGWIHEARAWVEKASLCAKSSNERAEVALNHALLMALSELDLTAVETAPLPSGPLAMLWRTKLKLIAATYRELSATDIKTTRIDLKKIQRALVDSEELYDAHAVAGIRADRLPGRWQQTAWRAVESLGLRQGQLATSSHALLRQSAIVLNTGGDPRDLLDRAEAGYRTMGHRVGQLQVEAERSKLAVERLGAPVEEFCAAAEALWNAGARRNALSALMEASQIAHRRGEREETIIVQNRLQTLAEHTGFSALAWQGLLHQAERAMRDGFHARARDLCDEALSKPLPRLLRAMTLVLRGSAQSFVKARDHAISDRQAACHIYLNLDAEDLASDVICALSGDISSSRTSDDVARADRLLKEWVERDETRGNQLAAYEKRLQRAECSILLQLADEQRTGVQANLEFAEEMLSAAEAALGPQPDAHPDRARMIPMRTQIEAQIATARGHWDAAMQANTKARLSYEHLGMPFETANCDYLTGCLWLNRTNEVRRERIRETARKALDALQSALSYYHNRAGMRLQTANTCHKIAKLIINVIQILDTGASHEDCTEAAQLLLRSAEEIDLLRRSYSAPGNMDNYTAKSTFSMAATDLTQDALRLHMLLRPDPAAAWLWVVRSKARAFADMVGAQAVVPKMVRLSAKSNPKLAELITREAELSKKLAEAPVQQRGQVSAELERTLTEMSAEPALVDYVTRRQGGAIKADELDVVAAETGKCFALVDWVQLGDSLFLAIARPGETPSFERIPVSVKKLNKELHHLFRDNRTRMTLRGGPERLEAYAPIVQPLEWLAKPGETLLFCPATILNSLPLHALPLGGTSVWHHHPIAYTVGLSVLRLSCSPMRPRGSGVRLFGDPTLDRGRARETAARIAETLGQQAELGSSADIEAVLDALRTSRVFHYQGHADFSEEEPMDAHLLLADQTRLTAREIFDLPDIVATTVTLGACKGARLGTMGGDEPLGIIAAFLVAGVRSVTAAAWPVSERSAGTLMENYYAGLLAGAAPIDALRQAALGLADNSSTADLYHWAPFRLYGNPWLAPFVEENSHVKRRTV